MSHVRNSMSLEYINFFGWYLSAVPSSSLCPYTDFLHPLSFRLYSGIIVFASIQELWSQGQLRHQSVSDLGGCLI